VWAEGLGSLHRVARIDERLADLEPVLRDRLTCSAGLLAERQVDDRGAGGGPDAVAVRGAWFRDGVTRMDDQQHALSGLLASAGRLTWGDT
jgi:hypothetical protein